MGGHPLLRIILVVIGFTLAGGPVWFLTNRPDAFLQSQVVPPQKLVQLSVKVSFSQSPRAFSLAYLGDTLFLQESGKGEYARNWEVSIPKEGIDLLLKAEVPGRTSVHVEISNGENILADKTFWPDSELVELVTLSETNL